MKYPFFKSVTGAVILAGALSITACTSAGNSAVSPASNPSSPANVTGGGLEDGQESATALLYANENVKNYDNSVFSQMTGPSDEMSNDAQRDLTLNNPNRIGYVYVYATNGTLVGFYTIKGKVSSTESQLTESQDIVEDSGCVSGVGYDGGYQEGACDNVVDSIGDDGTYGGEEGGPSGVYFYTTAGALVELGGTVSWFYSDAPMSLTTKPTIVYNDTKPTSGQVTVGNDGKVKGNG